MIFSVCKKIWVFGYRCYYPHRSRDALSPVCGILTVTVVHSQVASVVQFSSHSCTVARLDNCTVTVVKSSLYNHQPGKLYSSTFVQSLPTQRVSLPGHRCSFTVCQVIQWEAWKLIMWRHLGQLQGSISAVLLSDVVKSSSESDSSLMDKVWFYIAQ